MMRSCRLIAGLGFLVSCSAFAQIRTITLSVPGMTCPTCPITVKKALLSEHGVTAVAVHYEQKRLEVTFDDASITSQAIVNATGKVGFPSQLVR